VNKTAERAAQYL